MRPRLESARCLGKCLPLLTIKSGGEMVIVEAVIVEAVIVKALIMEAVIMESVIVEAVIVEKSECGSSEYAPQSPFSLLGIQV